MRAAPPPEQLAACVPVHSCVPVHLMDALWWQMADQGVIGAPHLLSHPTWLDTSSHLLRAAARSQWRQTPHSRGSRPAPRSRRHPAATPNRDPDPLAPLPPRRPPRPRPAPDAAAARPPPAGPAARPARRPAPPAWRAPRQGPGQGQGPLRRRWCQGLSSRRGRAHPFRPPASARAARHSLGCQVLRRRARGGGQAEMRLRMRQRLVAGGWRMRAGGPPAAAVPAPAERRARLW